VTAPRGEGEVRRRPADCLLPRPPRPGGGPTVADGSRPPESHDTLNRRHRAIKKRSSSPVSRHPGPTGPPPGRVPSAGGAAEPACTRCDAARRQAGLAEVRGPGDECPSREPNAHEEQDESHPRPAIDLLQLEVVGDEAPHRFGRVRRVNEAQLLPSLDHERPGNFEREGGPRRLNFAVHPRSRAPCVPLGNDAPGEQSATGCPTFSEHAGSHPVLVPGWRGGSPGRNRRHRRRHGPVVAATGQRRGLHLSQQRAAGTIDRSRGCQRSHPCLATGTR